MTRAQLFFGARTVFDSSQRSTSARRKRTFFLASFMKGMSRRFISLSNIPRLILRYSIVSALVISSWSGMGRL